MNKWAIKINLPATAEEFIQKYESISIQIKFGSVAHGKVRDKLGEKALKRGVYVHYRGKKILYVGHTTSGKSGTFIERMYRECRSTSGTDNGLHLILAKNQQNNKLVILDYDAIAKEKLIQFDGATDEQKALMLELAMIELYNPKGNIQGKAEKK